MADIRPFAALRPVPEYTSRIASLPYDVYSSAEAEKIIRDNPLSFLAIDFPEANPEGTEPGELLRRRMDEGLFVRDESPCYYVYAQTFRERTQAGIVALSSVDDYLNGVIRRHENTRKDKEDGRVRHIESCRAHTGPIFLCYRAIPMLSGLISRIVRDEPEADFISSGGVENRIFRVGSREDIDLITSLLASADHVYVADGHHRLAAAARVCLKHRETAGTADQAGDGTDYFLSVLFSDDELAILDYNRVLKDLNGLSPEELIKKISDAGFTVSGPSAEPSAPGKKGEFSLLLDGMWRTLTLDESLRPRDPVSGLDVSVLQERVLGPVFGIGDPRTDARIDFVGGIRGMSGLAERCSSDCACAFALYPTSMDELLAVADAGELMPPKSTWFEPKLLSGLFIHPFEDSGFTTCQNFADHL